MSYMGDGPVPPPQEVDPSEDAMEKFKEERVLLLNDMYAKLSRLYTHERDLAIYRLLRRENLPMVSVCRAFCMTPARMYQIIDAVEEEFGTNIE